MITQRFAVEFDRRTVGIAVRVPGGFMFYASDRRFDAIDGRLFRRARAIERIVVNAAIVRATVARAIVARYKEFSGAN